MPRSATQYAFVDRLGSSCEFYVDNEKRIISFIDWYSDLCGRRNRILFVVGAKGCGKSTLLQHCNNFITKKANYSILKEKYLDQQIETLEGLPKAKFCCISRLDVRTGKESISNSIYEMISKNPIAQFFNHHLASLKATVSNGLGSPEFSISLGLNAFNRDHSKEELITYLNRNKSIPHVVWFQSPVSKCYKDIIEFHEDLLSAGVTNLGMIISIDKSNFAIDDKLSCSVIGFNPLSISELNTLVFKVCNQSRMRHDIEIAEEIVKDGCQTYGEAIRILQDIEKENQKYISVKNAKKILEGIKHE